jgi:glycine/D-amino acid oxidase-like deaminating enzyme
VRRCHRNFIQVTGRSSAKITSQHSLIYRHLRDTFYLDTARAYADANRAGAAQIRTWIRDLKIVCDREESDAYAYTCKESLLADIKAEVDWHLQASLPEVKIRQRSDLLNLSAELASRRCFPFCIVGTKGPSTDCH